MSFFKIACPKCRKTLKVSHDLAGKSRTCPYCRTAFKVPDSEPTPTSSAMPAVKTGETSGSTRPRLPSSSTPKKKVIKRKPVEKSWLGVGGTGDSANSDVSLVISGVIAAILTAIWLAITYTMRGNQFGQLFWDRGPVPFPTTFLMFWAVAILVLKWMYLQKQREAMLLDVLPTEISEEITLESLDRFISHINDLPGATANSFLVNRVIRGIEHFRVRKSASDTVTMMESQSAIDANNVSGSYTIVKVFIWALPILGFIGTVMGVSAAVASLATSLSGGGDMNAMKAALQDVFGGLGTAFDTTLLALIMSMLVKLPASALQKSEEDLITKIDEYCNENLLRRLNDMREGGAERGAGGGGGGGANAKMFREACEQALGTQHAEMERWLKKLDAIGTRLTKQVSEGWDDVNAKIESQQQARIAEVEKSMGNQRVQLQTQLEQMATAAASIQATLERLAGGTEGMQDGVKSLSGLLERLSDEQVIVQQVEAPRRGWFGGRSKKTARNGKR